MAKAALDCIRLVVAGNVSRPFWVRQGNAADRGVVRQIFEQRDYDIDRFPAAPALRRFAARHGDRPLLVVDAGANIGAATVYLAQLDPRIRVLALEPEPNNFELFSRNCAGLAVTGLQCALSNTLQPLWLEDPGQGDWAFRVGARKSGTVVQAIDMPTLLERHGGDGIPFICKIDIEGGEDRLFASNDSWIERFALLIIELHDWMLPGTSNSRNFLRAISARRFDVVWRGENMFCFNNDLLGSA